jgi:hypothetical protein
MRLKRKLLISKNPKADPEKIKEWLEQAIEDEDKEVFDVLYTLYTDILYDTFQKQTIYSILYNEFAPSFGWSGEIRNWKEYEKLIDEIYGEKGKASEIITEYIFDNIDDFASPDEIDEAIERYGRRDWNEMLAFEIYEREKRKNNLQLWIDIIAPQVIRDIKTGELDIIEIADKFYSVDVVEDLFYDYVKHTPAEDIIRDAKKYGYYDELVKVLKLKYG